MLGIADIVIIMLYIPLLSAKLMNLIVLSTAMVVVNTNNPSVHMCRRVTILNFVVNNTMLNNIHCTWDQSLFMIMAFFHYLYNI